MSHTPTKFKLTAVVASSGASFEVDVHPTITGNELKQKIAEDTSIEMDHQVLFTQNGIKLKKLSLPLSHACYNNDIFISSSSSSLDHEQPENAQHVQAHHDSIEFTMSFPPHIYIYDKHHGEHPAISHEYLLNAVEYVIDEQKLQSSPPPHLLSDEKLREHALFQHSQNANKSILFQTLPKYEIEFEYHYNLALYVRDECIRKMSASKECVKQIQFQYKSLRVLLRHFTNLKDKLSKQHNRFISKCEQQITNHQVYLNDFENDLKKLQSVQLHASLQTKSRQTMLDVVDEGSFRSWFNKASLAQDKQKTLRDDRLKQKASIDEKFETVKQSVDEIKRKKINFNAIKQELKRNEKLFDELKSIIAVFDSNRNKIQETMAAIMNEEEQSDNHGFNPTETEKCREEQIKVHLVKVREINACFLEMVEHIASVQEAMVNEFTSNVADITRLNMLISSESKCMDAYGTALDRKDALFFEFVKLKALPDAYSACIREIVRRRAFGILMQRELNQHLVGIFDIFRNAEQSKRKKFIAEYGMLPVDLVDGLTNMPGQIRVAYQAHNEESLPVIDDEIDVIKAAIGREFRQTISDYAVNNRHCKWEWKGYENVDEAEDDDETNNKDAAMMNGGCNNKQNKLDVLKEQNKWQSEKLRLQSRHEEEVAALLDALSKVEAKNEDLQTELEQYKREEFPDPPSSLSQRQSSDGGGGMMMNSEFILSQLSTILGASISNVHPSALEQSRMLLSRMNLNGNGTNDNDNSDSDKLLATNQVLQEDVEKLRAELVCKESALKKMKAEREKLEKQNREFAEKLDKLTESSSALRDEMTAILAQHEQELESVEQAHAVELEAERRAQLQLQEDMMTYRSDIGKLNAGRTKLLEQIKLISDANEEWEEKYKELVAQREQKENDDWLAYSYCMNQQITQMKANSICLNFHFESHAQAMTGCNLLFVRDSDTKTYMAILHSDNNDSNSDSKFKSKPVILSEEGVTERLKQLQYPRLLTGEVFQIIERTWPQNMAQQRLQKGEPVLIVTAGCLKAVNFQFA